MWQLLLLTGLWLAVPSALATEVKPMTFRHLTVADGLSQSTVMDIHQDSRGYIWLATENGLDRYDGYSVRRYQRGVTQNGELANDYIWQIAEDHLGHLWLATNGGGVARWNPETDRFTHFRHDENDPQSLTSDHIRSLLITPSGVWAGTQHAGLNLLDPDTGKVVRYRHDPSNPGSLPHDDVLALAEDRDGSIWVGTNDGLARIDAGADWFQRFAHDPDDSASLSHNRVNSLYLDSLGTLWVGTFGGGLNALNPRSGRFTRYLANSENASSLSDNTVWDVLEDDDGRLWVATAQGLNLMLPASDTFATYFGGDGADQMTDSYIMSLHHDDGGVLWIGTRFGGANTWNSDSWQFGHHRPDWLEGQSVSAFSSDQQGFWTGTFGGGLIYSNDLTGEVRHLSTASTPALTDDRVMSLLRDRNGALWIGTMEGGINRLSPDGSSVSVFRQDDADPGSLPVQGAMNLYEDAAGEIWIGTFGNGITRFDPRTGSHRQFLPDEQDPTSLCGAQGRAFAEDLSGRLWVGTENGLCRFDAETESFTQFRNEEGNNKTLSDNSIYAIHVDPKGTLWIGTGGGGLNRVDLGSVAPEQIQFETISRRQGLSSNLIYAIQADAEGSLWLSGNNGLTRYRPETGTVTTHRLSQGLQGNEFHYGASHRSAIGTLFFGGSNGFNRFDPLRLAGKQHQPSVVLTKLSLMNEPLHPASMTPATEGLQLEYNAPNITLEFSALDYTEPENNRYWYRLVGFQDDWVEAGTRHSATYTNLPAGNYRFEVRAAGSTGNQNLSGLSVPLAVNPAPWATSGAYVSYALFVFGMIGLYIRQNRMKLAKEARYSRQLEAEVQERTAELAVRNQELMQLTEMKSQFLARMSHEIRSPINGILGMSELLARGNLTHQQQKYANTITSSGESLLQVINDVLDFSRLEADMVELDNVDTDLEQLLSETVDMFALEASRKGLELILRLPPTGLPGLQIDGMRLKQVLINLLTNALKFTEQGWVELQVAWSHIDRTRAELSFAVADTGIGIAPENQKRIFESFSQEDGSTTRRFGGTGLGLAICKELLALMGSEPKLRSEPGQGATFSFDLVANLASEQATSTPSLKGSALIVCQQPPLADLLEHYLADWGLYTRTVGSAVAALDMLTRPVGQSIDYLLIDDRLSDFSGADLVESALSQGLIRENKCIRLGAFDTDIESTHPDVHRLSKPVKRLDLLQAVDNTDTPLEDAKPAASASDVRLAGRVLLVEDNPVNQDVFTGMLAVIGCDSQCVADGASALTLAAEGDFDAVLMDFELPDMNGADTTRKIRALKGYRSQVPIIALTANTTPADEALCLDAGMDAFLPKPCSLGTLTECLTRWLPVVDTPAGKDESVPSDTEADTEADTTGQFDQLALARIQQLTRPDGTSMLDHAVALFLQTADESVAILRNAETVEDMEAIRFNAHKLKSGCANLGANSMAELCRQLEENARLGQPENISSLITHIESELVVVTNWLKEQLRESA
jgi:signal transduction histidine kinase/ligand-binding sensor domain-containing protein/CheY-like chemotaxis protein/HPt (histidine-containing phosphotransfer) domain-containing protein